MEPSNFFIALVLILLSARLLGELAAKFSVPSVIGELLAGIIIGPSVLGWVQPSEAIELLAEIGIVLLLFEVGLESDISRLAKAGTKASIAALAGVIVPFALGFLASLYLFHLTTIGSLFVGSTLTATSIGITLRVLSDLKRQSSHEAQIVLGAAILDDIVGIVLLSIIFELSSGHTFDIFSAGKLLMFILLFLVLAPIFAKLISNIINRYERVSDIPGLLTTSTVALILLFAWLAHVVGAPELLGGFAAGLALSRKFFVPLPLKTDKDFSHRIEKNMKPIIYLFIPIFFVNIGLRLDLSQIVWSSPFFWLFVIVILLAAIIGKLASGLVLPKEKNWVKWAVGIAMIPRGEVGLIFAEIGRANNVFNPEIYAGIVIVIAITTILTPIVLRYFYQRIPHRHS